MADKVFADRYKLAEKIGSSRIADVYRAHDETLGRSVAVKVIKRAYAEDEQFAARLKREAQAAASLSNPYVVNFYDWGSEDGLFYIVMELVQGTTLEEGIKTHGALDPRKVARIGIQICSALTAAHNYRIIHGALNARNIMVQPDGDVKVMDFGVPRINTFDLTHEQSDIDLVNYASPEQIKGNELTAASDIYSLGIVLYQAATGRLPFGGNDSPMVALEQLKEQTVPPSQENPEVTPELEAIIMHCLNKAPEDRFASAAKVKSELEHCQNLTSGFSSAPTTAMGTVDPTRVMGGVASAAPLAGATQVMPGVPQQAGGANGGARTYRGTEAGMQQPKKRKKWPIVAAIIAIVAIVGIVLGLTMCGGDKTEVPDVTNRTQAEATQMLTAAGFQVGTITEKDSETVTAGNVISQTPSAGKKAAAGTKVSLVISSGPKAAEKVSVPDLSKMTPQAAEAAITQAGLVAAEGTSIYSDTVDAGLVCQQTPAAGTSIEKGATVTYSISLGKANVKIPDVTGTDQTAATTTLKTAGFAVNVEEDYSDSVPKGAVVSQNPSAGTEVTPGTTVVITVSAGPKPVEQATVPNLIGLTESQATSALETAGLKITVTYEMSPVVTEAMVTEQNPSAGEQIDVGSSVKVTILRSSDA